MNARNGVSEQEKGMEKESASKRTRFHTADSHLK